MLHAQILSKREKVLSVIGASLLVVFVTVGFAQDGKTEASVLLAQDSDTANQLQNMKGQIEYLKNMRREVADILREAKTLDVSKVNASLDQFDACVKKQQGMVGTSDFWSMQNECQDYSRSAEDILNNELRPARTCAQNKRSIDDRRREKKNNIDRQIKDILRNSKTADVSGLNTMATQIDAAIAQADQLLAGTCNQDTSSAVQDIQSDLNGIFQDFYSAANDIGQKANDSRRADESKKDFEKNIKRQCEKDMSREYKNFQKEVTRVQKKGTFGEQDKEGVAKVDATYNRLCVELFGTMAKSLESGDVDAFEEARNEFNTSNRDFWDTMNDVRGGLQEADHKAETLKNITQDLKQKEQQLKQMNRSLVSIKKKYNKAAKRFTDASDRKEALVKFAELIAAADDLTNRMTEGIATAKADAPNDPDSYWMENGDDLNELQQDFQEVQQNLEMLSSVMRGLQEADKGIKSFQKELARQKAGGQVSDDQAAQLQEILDTASTKLKEAWAAALTSPDDAITALETLRDMGEQWDEVFQGE